MLLSRATDAVIVASSEDTAIVVTSGIGAPEVTGLGINSVAVPDWEEVTRLVSSGRSGVGIAEFPVGVGRSTSFVEAGDGNAAFGSATFVVVKSDTSLDTTEDAKSKVEVDTDVMASLVVSSATDGDKLEGPSVVAGIPVPIEVVGMKVGAAVSPSTLLGRSDAVATRVAESMTSGMAVVAVSSAEFVTPGSSLEVIGTSRLDSAVVATRVAGSATSELGVVRISSVDFVTLASSAEVVDISRPDSEVAKFDGSSEVIGVAWLVTKPSAEVETVRPFSTLVGSAEVVEIVSSSPELVPINVTGSATEGLAVEEISLVTEDISVELLVSKSSDVVAGSGASGMEVEVPDASKTSIVDAAVDMVEVGKSS